jgi:DNA polymerase I
MTAESEIPTLFLIDGNNYMYRAFHAIRDLSNSKGFPTNAIYGFTTMLMKLLREWKPDYIVVVFDAKGPTFRHQAFDGYKATRKETPQALIPQIAPIKNIVRGFSIPVLEKQGIEADDVIGTLARKYASAGMRTIIVSGDKDLMQLVNHDVTMIDTMNNKTYDMKAVRERFGVGPDKVAEILGLTGDTSDNIPGVPGVGPKGAQRLIEEFGSVEGVLENIDKLRNEKLRESMRKYSEQARMSRYLALIKTDVEVDFDLESARYSDPDVNALKELFKEFEFSSLIQELKLRETSVDGTYHLVLTGSDLDGLTDKLREAAAFSLDILADGPPMRAEVIGIAIAPSPGQAYYIPLAHDYAEAPGQLHATDVMQSLSPFLSASGIQKHGHDLKNIMILLSRRGVVLKEAGCDTMVASYILNPARQGFELADVARDHADRQIMRLKELAGSGIKMLPCRIIPVEKAMDYTCRRVDAVLTLASILTQKIAEEGFDTLYHQVEMPLISVLAAMEQKGVLIDLKIMKEMSRECEQLLSLSEAKIYQLAGEKFNVNSPKQLQSILFDKLGLPKGRKTKDGYSTDVDVLTSLGVNHELPAEILAYRSLSKLKSTYIDALPALVNPETGRIHTSYNQTVTATGRLSSSNPNLQNIPIRTLEGKRIRQAFIAPEGWEIVSADYSQIELRILAHLSADAALIDAFTSGEDIHSRTASNIFGVFPEMVNPDMRRQAKVINFGILYGMSAFGLSKELGINQRLAQDYITEYFRKYEGVRSFLDGILERARQTGYVTTLLNRRRYLPEINSRIAPVRQFAERMAANTPIQGTAADLIKIAMINIHNQFTERNMSSCMIMQVHDELVFECPSSERDAVMELVKEKMEGVIKLKVPLKVDIAFGRNWDEAH